MAVKDTPEPRPGTKIWRNNKKDLRDLTQWMSKGTTVYTVYEMATNLAPYEDSQTYTDQTCTGRHPLLRDWMFGANVTIERLLFEYGPVYEVPPPGLRHISDPHTVDGPLPKGREHGRTLCREEIAYLEGRIKEADEARKKGNRKEEKETVGAGAKRSRWW